MSTDYSLGGPYEISTETLAEMMTRGFAPRGKGDQGHLGRGGLRLRCSGRPGAQPADEADGDLAKHRETRLRRMSRHGAYDESLKYAVKAGLASKTGVDGAIMGQLNSHQDFVFCGQHSDLNFAGNSGEVLKWIVDLSRMRLEWPHSGVATHPLPPNVPSGQALHELLQRLLKPTTRAALQASLDTIIRGNIGPDDNKGKYVRKGGAHKAGFYLKLNPKNKPIDDEVESAPRVLRRWIGRSPWPGGSVVTRQLQEA